MKVYISLHGHANKICLPLRFGLSLNDSTEQITQLIDAQFDEVATRNQRPDEIERQRKHYLGKLLLNHSINDRLQSKQIDCRVVLEQPQSQDKYPSVITVLSQTNTIGDSTITRHLEGMLKKGRITLKDVLDIFHPAYKSGKIKDSTDCEDIFRQHLEQKVIQTPNDEPLYHAIKNNAESLIEQIEQVAEIKSPENSILPIFSKKLIPLTNVKYDYIFAEAYVKSVQIDSDKITLKTIGSNGEEIELQSFKVKSHLIDHHNRTYNYLKDREGERAIFAVCISPEYKGVIAESVTSIALQLMKTVKGSPKKPSSSGVIRPRGAWESMAASTFFEGESSLMSDSEYEMIYGEGR